MKFFFKYGGLMPKLRKRIRAMWKKV